MWRGRNPYSTSNKFVSWSTQDARDAFLKAFAQEYELPEWIKEVEILPLPHSGGCPIARFHCEGTAIELKVFREAVALPSFRWCYPQLWDMAVVIICEEYGARFIRQITFAVIQQELQWRGSQ